MPRTKDRADLKEVKDCTITSLLRKRRKRVGNRTEPLGIPLLLRKEKVDISITEMDRPERKLGLREQSEGKKKKRELGDRTPATRYQKFTSYQVLQHKISQ